MTIVEKKKRCSSRCINDDLLSEILFRLPYKALAGAKLVSKSWNSLIKTPRFSQTYNRRINKRNNPPHFLFLDLHPTILNMYHIDGEHFARTKSAMSIPNCYNYVVSSSSGLVCISGGYWSKSLALFNPTSNDLFRLPNLPHPLLAFMAFSDDDDEEEEDDDDDDLDEMDGNHDWDIKYLNVVSFGYHPPTNQYKVVQLLRDPAARVARCYVLSVSARSGACSWRAVEESLMCQARIDQPVGCINGVIYWENFTFAGESVDIISFDLGTEKLKLVPTPWRCESNHPSQTTRHLVELENKLCFVKTECNASFNDEQLQMDIWMLMKSDNAGDLKSWTHMYRLELGPCSREQQSLTAFFPLCVDHYNNRILFYDRVTYDYKLMYAYHLNDNTLEVYDDCRHYGAHEFPLVCWQMTKGYNCVTHTQALVSLD